ncbi:MAG: 2Fe-2S iron-sulfur cluster-binding protein [Spirochaetales bacterium]
MNIPVQLNDITTVVNYKNDETLLYILRAMGLHSVRCGCTEGLCGSCSILLDGKTVPACLIPVGAVRERNITTLEHFYTTKEYNDIKQGFDAAGITLCGYCNAGKIFTAHEIIATGQRPTPEDIAKRIQTLHCLCTDNSLLIQGIVNAFDIRYERLWSLKYAR